MKTTIESTALEIGTLPDGRDPLPRVKQPARGLLIAAAFSWLAEHPEAAGSSGAPHRFWESVRETIHNTATGETVGTLLCSPSFADPVGMLGNLLFAVRKAGSLECALVAQRDVLTAELAQLRGQAPTGPHPV